MGILSDVEHPQAIDKSTHEIYMEKLHLATPYIHLGPPKRNPNIELSLLNLPIPFSPTTTSLIQYLILKPLQNLPRFILIKINQSRPPIQTLYHF